jgi:hypothetical protein
MGTYSGVAVVPARPYHRPRHRAEVEVGVQIIESWMVAALRHRQFFQLDDLNRAVWARKRNIKPPACCDGADVISEHGFNLEFLAGYAGLDFGREFRPYPAAICLFDPDQAS